MVDYMYELEQFEQQRLNELRTEPQMQQSDSSYSFIDEEERH